MRAADAALSYAQPDATIVIWSSLQQPPEGALQALEHDRDEDIESESGDQTAESFDDQLPDWDRFAELAGRLRVIMREHRLLLHSRLSPELVEPMGFGVVESAHQLANLSHGFDSCGVLRAVSFAGGY